MNRKVCNFCLNKNEDTVGNENNPCDCNQYAVTVNELGHEVCNNFLFVTTLNLSSDIFEKLLLNDDFDIEFPSLLGDLILFWSQEKILRINIDLDQRKVLLTNVKAGIDYEFVFDDIDFFKNGVTIGGDESQIKYLYNSITPNSAVFIEFVNLAHKKRRLKSYNFIKRWFQPSRLQLVFEEFDLQGTEYVYRDGEI